MIGLNHFFILSALLFCIGLYGVLASKNAIRVLMSVEIMFNAAIINFVALSKYLPGNGVSGQILAIFTYTIAAAGVVVGIALVVAVYRNFQDISLDEISLMKW